MYSKKFKGSRFRYQVYPMGGFSPLKRAFEVYKQLDFNIKRDTSPEDFLGYLSENYPDIYKAIDWIKFFPRYRRPFKVNGQKKEIEFRIALLYIEPDPKIRQKNFDLRSNITKETGWYPSTMGSKAISCHYKFKKVFPNMVRSIGEIQSLFHIKENRDRYRKIYGSSFELKGNRGTYLLDCGTIDYNKQNVDYSLIFLSHYHFDHRADIIHILNKNPHSLLVSSEPTLVTLDALYTTELEDENKRRLYDRTCKIGFNETIKFEDGGNICFFPVYHCPGAFGLKYIDCKNHHFTYFGDFCLKNGIHDVWDELIENVVTKKGRKNTVLLDAALIGKRDSIDKDDTPEVIFDEISRDAIKKNIFIISNQSENLIYSYLSIWKIINSHPDLGQRIILLSTKLYNTLRSLWRAVVDNKKEFQDPIIKKIAKIAENKLKNPIETFRLYPLNQEVLSKINLSEKCIYFADHNDFTRFSNLKHKLDGAYVFITGTIALREKQHFLKGTKKIPKVRRVLSEDWSFHSKEEHLKDFIKELVNYDIKVILFHNSKKRLMEFVYANNFSHNDVLILGGGKSIEL